MIKKITFPKSHIIPGRETGLSQTRYCMQRLEPTDLYARELVGLTKPFTREDFSDALLDPRMKDNYSDPSRALS